jgi:hypothetical protein
VIVGIFGVGFAAGVAVALLSHWLRLHAVFALAGALAAALVLTALLVHEATVVDGIPPTRYDRAVIAIGFAVGAVFPVLVLAFARWASRRAEAAPPASD